MTAYFPSYALPLKEMGEYALAAEILQRSPEEHKHILTEAMNLAAFLHRDHRRQNRGDLPRDTYLTHPLRNTLRLLRAGVTDKDTLVASILHDTVEDGAEEMINLVAIWTLLDTTPETYRYQAERYLQFRFGDAAAGIVMGVTNPFYPADASRDEKHTAYVGHVQKAVAKDPRVALVKLSDFVDNAVGLYHNTGNARMQRNLAHKYLPLIPTFKAVLRKKNIKAMLSESGLRSFSQQLEEGEIRLKELAG